MDVKQKIIILLLISGLIAFYFLTKEDNRVKPTKLTTNKQIPVSNADTIIGIIRTTGLTDEDRKRAGLNFGEYQITDFNQTISNQENKILGYYLEANDPQYKILLGKCVKAKGVTKILADNQLYERVVFTPSKIEKNNSTICGSYDSAITEENINTLEKQSFTGTLRRFSRPAPEISYDYELAFDQPFTDEDNASGLPQEIKSIIIVPKNNQVWKKIEDKMDKKATVYGYMLSGFAESEYFEVEDLDS